MGRCQNLGWKNLISEKIWWGSNFRPSSGIWLPSDSFPRPHTHTHTHKIIGFFTGGIHPEVSHLTRREVQIEWKVLRGPKISPEWDCPFSRCPSWSKRTIGTPILKASLIFPQLILDNDHEEGCFKPRTKALRGRCSTPFNDLVERDRWKIQFFVCFFWLCVHLCVHVFTFGSKSYEVSGKVFWHLQKIILRWFSSGKSRKIYQ